jgi:hypothetical protein
MPGPSPLAPLQRNGELRSKIGMGIFREVKEIAPRIVSIELHRRQAQADRENEEW